MITHLSIPEYKKLGWTIISQEGYRKGVVSNGNITLKINGSVAEEIEHGQDKSNGSNAGTTNRVGGSDAGVATPAKKRSKRRSRKDSHREDDEAHGENEGTVDGGAQGKI